MAEQRRERLIPLVSSSYDDGDRAAVTEAVEHSCFGSGAYVNRLEQTLAAHYGCAGGVATVSGTAALHLALLALGIGPRDTVLLPSYTCVALLHAVTLAGAAPLLLDNDPWPAAMDYNYDLATLPTAWSRPGRSVLLVPHMFGVAAPCEPDRGPSWVIEDITMAPLTVSDSRGGRAGTRGDLVVLSCAAGKFVSCGRGGIVLGRTAALAERLRDLCEDEQQATAARYRSVAATQGAYQLRLNVRMADPQAALALSQWRRVLQFAAARWTLAERYTALLQDAAERRRYVLPDSLPTGAAYDRYLIWLCRDGGGMGRVRPVLAGLGARGIEGGRGVYPPLHRLLGLPDRAYAEASACADSVVSLPLYPGLTEGECDAVASAFLAVLEEVRA